MSITKIADKLRSFDLITEQTYQKVKQLIELSDMTRSTLMYEVKKDAAKRYPKFFNEKERQLTTNTIDRIISFLEKINLLKHLQP
ncbi:hypothetical protein DSM106972_016700 [Dulcicalothrix desertica PCC 7102]|uniref:Uncharacterized protein n=1 Tax=Dulcicalothrix desertica PCC 7102 TaxID=232991 RepID=A0A3S1ATB5_9CYAN|nr:hypothetical protein [Dulcicalothrix desertica]RUT08502.1 hypothetical protein DSM106972_016700 [Dulcicalothrix desertica PCC 7102]